MKFLNFLLLFTIGTVASAAELPSLKVDLDGDGTPDLVRILPLNGDHNRLAVTLSMTGRVFTIDSLVKTTWSQSTHEPDDGSICDGLNVIGLSAGKGHSFVLSEQYSDFGGCAGQLNREFVVGLGITGLKVIGLRVSANSYSMGDPSPSFRLALNFQARTVQAVATDAHRREHEDKLTKSLPASCGPMRLAEFQNDALPECVKTALKPFTFLDCGRQEDLKACPVPRRW